MYLLLSIFLSSILGLILYSLPLHIGAIITFGIVIGCIFRAMFILKDIHKRLSAKIPMPKKGIWDKTYENHAKKSNKSSYIS